MAENPKASWPKTPDGTIDWETVFEDPQTGFVPIIQRAQNAATLKAAATLIVEKLYTRRNDADDRAIQLTRLGDQIDANAPFETSVERIVRMLRSIKDDRIEKAHVFVERKKAGQSLERRSTLLWKLNVLLKPKVLIPAGAVLVALLGGIFYVLLQSPAGPDAPSGKTPLAQGGIQADTPSTEQASLPPADSKPVEEEPLPVWFQSVRWPNTTLYTTAKPQYYSVTLFVKTWDQKVEICRRLPSVMDRFYVSFSERMPIERNARDSELEQVANDIKGSINALLGSPVVISAAVGRYGTKAFTIASQPPYCKSPSSRQPPTAPQE